MSCRPIVVQIMTEVVLTRCDLDAYVKEIPFLKEYCVDKVFEICGIDVRLDNDKLITVINKYRAP